MDAPITAQELYIRSIELDPQWMTYYQLAQTLSGKQNVVVNTKSMNQQELLLTCICLNPQFANAYYELVNTLSNDEKIKLLDGTEMTKQELVQKSIKLDPRLKLGLTMEL